ncbi:MAG TPA: tetratricopeptide repeat protein [Candidatus Dormibacteraeota bacterium]|nr:tetratricopeptide repeat protein [Candidatus Dormibacteraeota bacterium]
MSGDRLRRLWDFDDLEATGTRLGKQIDAETDDAGRAEVLTQLARLQGLRDEFRAGEAVLRRAEGLAGNSKVARIRIDLERGRLLRSSGDPAAALPLFVSACDAAIEAGEEFIAADSAHMAALAAPDHEAKLDWTRRGIDIAESSVDRDVAYWMGPLLNNLGVTYSDAGEREAALDAFERALEARLHYPENPTAIEHARASVAEARRALGMEA